VTRAAGVALTAAALLGAAACRRSTGVRGPGPAGDGGGVPPIDGAGEGPAYAPPFSLAAMSGVRIGSEGSTGWAVIGRAYADVDFGEAPFASVSLAVELDTACFPFDKWASDPPPPGQSWPADCDAFDRNLDVFVDDGSAPPFEVIHAITPFGGPEHLAVDITDLVNGLPGAHRLRVDLTSFSDAQGLVTGSNAGWTVSARVDVVPGPAPRRVLAAVPLFAGQIAAGDPLPSVSWTVPDGTTASRLEYRTSGHGQGPRDARCLGPAEEFCDRRHQIFVDGATVEDIEPYREDCQTLCTLAHQGPPDGGLDYCQENPCGDPASVRSPRANWCPGSMTPPFAWGDIPALTIPGPHVFSFQVSGIGTGGFWLASAIYYAYGN
jgi:hypothetical protein